MRLSDLYSPSGLLIFVLALHWLSKFFTVAHFVLVHCLKNKDIPSPPTKSPCHLKDNTMNPNLINSFHFRGWQMRWDMSRGVLLANVI